MAELAASILSIIAFTLKSSELLYRFFHDVRDAPYEIVSIKKEALDLAGALNAIHALVANGIVLSSAASLLGPPLNSCKGHLQALYRLLCGFTHRGKWNSAFTWRLKRGKIAGLRRSISISQQTLATTLTIAQSHAIFAGNQELSRKLESVLQSQTGHAHLEQREISSTSDQVSSTAQPILSGLYELPGSDHPWARVPAKEVFAIEML